MSTTFANLNREAQIALLEGVAAKALAEFGIEPAQIESINHEFNSTFKVTTKTGELFALRINVNSPRSVENLRAEVTWVRSIDEVATPKPVQAASGEYFTIINSAEAGRDFASVLYTWISGTELAEDPTEEKLFELGAAMARMHLAGRRELGDGCALSVLDDPLWHVAESLLKDSTGLTAEEQDLVREAYRRIAEYIDKLYSSGEPQLIHADMHGANVMWGDAGLTIFDFDDCAIGFPIQDLFTTLYYLDTDEQDAAVLRGYASVATLPEFSDEDRKILLMQRRLVLTNTLPNSSMAHMRELFPKYNAETIRRLREWLS